MKLNMKLDLIRSHIRFLNKPSQGRENNGLNSPAVVFPSGAVFGYNHLGAGRSPCPEGIGMDGNIFAYEQFYQEEPMKPAGHKLTVIIRDDAALIYSGDMPTYRRVTLDLTIDQIDKLALYATAKNGGRDIFESVSNCFLED